MSIGFKMKIFSIWKYHTSNPKCSKLNQSFLLISYWAFYIWNYVIREKIHLNNQIDSNWNNLDLLELLRYKKVEINLDTNKWNVIIFHGPPTPVTYLRFFSIVNIIWIKNTQRARQRVYSSPLFLNRVGTILLCSLTLILFTIIIFCENVNMMISNKC